MCQNVATIRCLCGPAGIKDVLSTETYFKSGQYTNFCNHGSELRKGDGTTISLDCVNNIVLRIEDVSSCFLNSALYYYRRYSIKGSKLWGGSQIHKAGIKYVEYSISFSSSFQFIASFTQIMFP